MSITFGRDEASSFTFTCDNTIHNAYIMGIGGLTAKNFSTKQWTLSLGNGDAYTHDNLYDAEKTYANANDDLLCWAASAANMLAWTGWGEAGLNLSVKNPEDAIFSYYINNFIDNGFNTEMGLNWFFGSLPYYYSSYLKNQNSGNLFNFQAPTYNDTSLATLEKDLKNKNGVGISFFTGPYEGHAITVFGYTSDAKKSASDPGYYTGIFITDSDDNKLDDYFGGTADDILCYIPMTYDSAAGSYRLDPAYLRTSSAYGNVYTYTSLVPRGNLASIGAGKSVSGECIYNATQQVYGKSVSCRIVSGGVQGIHSGGSVSSGEIWTSGIQNVSKGGVASLMVVSSGGVQNVIGGSALHTVIGSSGAQIVSSGGLADDTIIDYDGLQNIKVGGLAAKTIISAGGSQLVSGHASDVWINYGGSQIIEGGYAENVIISSGGSQFVSSGGVASRVDILCSYAGQNVVSGGIARDVSITNGGLQEVSSGGLAEDVLILSGGSQYIYAGGSALNVTIHSGGFQYVFSGGYVSGGIVYAGGSHVADYFAIVHNLNVEGGENSGGVQTVVNGAVTHNVSLGAGASQIVSDGGRAVATYVGNGGRAFQHIVSGGVASGAVVDSSSVQHVSGGGQAVGAKLKSSGWQIIDPGAKATDTVISRGAAQIVHSDGIASGASVLSGGSQLVLAGGSALNITVSSGGQQIVHSNGYVSGGIVYSGGSHIAYAGALVYAVAVEGPGGVQVARNGAVVRNASVNSGGSQIVSSGGKAISTYLGKDGRAQQFIKSGGIASHTTVDSASDQYISRGGLAVKAVLKNHGWQHVSAGGSAQGTNIAKDGAQKVFKNGFAVATLINSGGSQVISGGKASGAIVGKGGSQGVYSGGKAVMGVVSAGGVQAVYSLAIASAGVVRGSQVVYKGASSIKDRLSSGGRQMLSGGMAAGAIISKGGLQIIYSGGTGRYNNVKYGASQLISSGGKALQGTVSAGGRQMIYSGGLASANVIRGNQYIYRGGSSIKDRIASGGRQNVSCGLVSSAIISKGGLQVIYSGGVGRFVTVSKGGSQLVSRLGIVSGAKILGATVIASGGLARGVNVGAGGSLKVAKGGRLYLTGNTSVAGVINITEAAVTGAANAGVSLSGTAASLTLGKGVSMKNAVIKVNSGKLFVSGAGNTVARVVTAAKSITTFDIGGIAAKGASFMLSATRRTALVGSVRVATKSMQQAGVYELSKNLLRSSGASVKILCDGKTVGSVKNGSSLSKNGMTYKLVSASGQLKLNVSVQEGMLKKGTAAANALSGAAKGDIFYGAQGNDRINGNGGRDVAVYDKTSWGKDIITQTSGTMTILFSGIGASQITQTRKGKDMVISRKGASAQSITVKNWNATRHNIVFGGTMGQFSKYIAAAKPTASVQSAARKEIWQKAGLLA